MTNHVYSPLSEKTKSQMFFGDGHFVQEFLELEYPWALKSADRQNNQDWAFDEFNLKLDAQQLSSANNAVRHIFTTNLQSQIFADTIQGRGPSWLIPYISDPSLEYAFTQWARFEMLHSRTYTHILTSMYPNPRIVLDMIEQKPEIFARFSIAIEQYNAFFDNPTKKNLVLLIAAINILEGLSFYSSFICNFSFAKQGLFESVSKFLQLIARDEALHLGITQQIIKTWSSGKDGPEWKALWEECKPFVRDMYIRGIEQEFVFTKYLFMYGTPIVGLNEEILNQCNIYYGNKRMRNIGLKPYNNLTKDPLPWVQAKYLSTAGVQDAPQEVSLNTYLKDSVIPLQYPTTIHSLFDKVVKKYAITT